MWNTVSESLTQPPSTTYIIDRLPLLSRLCLSVMDSRTRYSKPAALVLLLAALAALSHVPAAFALSTTITFYLHDNLLTFPSSADVIVPPNLLIAPLNSYYGTYVVFDDSITNAPSATSLEIGRGRGSYLFDAKDTAGAGIQFIWTAQFNAASGAPGSTLSFMGFDRTTDAMRFISVIGGTGVFVKASGQASITTYSLVGAAAVLNITATFTCGM